jgi:hypothetical protein
MLFTLYIATTGAPIHLRTHRVRRNDARIALATSCYLRCCGEGQHAVLSSHGDKGDAAGVIRCADILDSSFEVGGGGAAATTTNEYTCYGHPDALLVGIGGRSHMPCRAMGCGGRGKAAACSICPRPRGEPELTIAALYYFGRCVSECPEGTVRSGFTCTCARTQSTTGAALTCALMRTGTMAAPACRASQSADARVTLLRDRALSAAIRRASRATTSAPRVGVRGRERASVPRALTPRTAASASRGVRTAW